MKKVLLTLTGLLCLLPLVACASPVISTTNVVKTITTQLPTETTTQTIITTVPSLVVIDPSSGNRYIVEQGSVGVGNADNRIDGYAIGLSPSGVVYVLNGTTSDMVFKASVEPYATADNSYVAAPPEISQWVTLSNVDKNSPSSDLFLMKSMDASVITVTLDAPEGALLPVKWGFMVAISSPNRVIATSGFTSLGYDVKSNTDVTFNWTMIPIPPDTPGVGEHPNTSGYPSKVMIRSKVGNYPAASPDFNTAPSDGTLVYYGQGNTCEDNQGSPYTYYGIYVQKVDGTWYQASGVTTVNRSASRFLVNMR